MEHKTFKRLTVAGSIFAAMVWLAFTSLAFTALFLCVRWLWRHV